MDTSQEPTTGARVLGPTDGEVAGAPESRTDRFMIDSKDTGGRLSVVEHTLPPQVLAGPLHHHSREDEYSYVLEGRLGRCWATRRSTPRPGIWSSSHVGSGTPSGTPATPRRGSWS
jgi:mannose-6-phosphate isomerase-like protein (cupin superfamily)